MKTRILLLVSILIAACSFCSTSHAQTTVRGQLLHNGQYPAGGIQVTLYSQTLGRSLPATTGNDGMFYLYNVPFGAFYLEIWVANPPQTYPVQITAYPYHDLPRLPVP
jgi:hypothetical protein